jgi:hypothetical protein
MVFTFPVSRHFPVGGLSEPPIQLIDLILLISEDVLVFCSHIGFIVNFRFFAGYFWVFCFNSLIINTIHFSGMQAIAGNFCGEVRYTMGVLAMVVVMLGEII